MKSKKWIQFIIKFGVLKIVVSFFVLFIILKISNSYFDITIASSIIIVWLIDSLDKTLTKLLLNHIEDSIKLTEDYSYLLKSYVIDDKWIRRKNNNESNETIFPVIKDCDFRKYQLDIQDIKDERYKLPETLQEHFYILFSSHTTSKIYNQLTIKVNRWGYEEGKFKIYTSRTTYFDSLVTNRAMDFEFSKGLTVRELYQFGPFFPKIEDSCLSNHLGFNGFIESADGYILFIKRHSKNSIGKRTYGNSIGASLKAKYALDDNGTFTLNGLLDSFKKEIFDEVKVNEDELKKISLEENLIAAYRDVLEGGKPQLLFYVLSTLSKDEIESNFSRRKLVKKKHNVDITLEDGKNFYWIHRDELSNITIYPDKIIQRSGKHLPMLPSASASVVMLLDYLSI